MLGIIRATDLMIADVSSVTLDHLYLRPDAPIALCDRRSNRVRLLDEAPVAAGSHIVDQTSIADLAADLAAMLADDPPRARRRDPRDHSFDSLEPGQSTERFWSEMKNAMRHHDSALRELSRLRIIEESA